MGIFLYQRIAADYWYRYILRSVLSSVFLIPLLTTAVNADTNHPASAHAPVLTSACELDYPPFCVVDEAGRASGFSVDLLKEAMRAMGRQVSFRTGPWSDVRGWLEQGAVEALPLVGRTPERESVFDFTFPYLTLRGAIVTRDSSRSIRTMDDLRGKNVAVMAGDNAEEFLRRGDYGCVIHTTRTFRDALTNLARGRYDAVVVQRLLARRLISDMGLTDLRIADHPLDELKQEFCFAVREGDRHTLAVLNEGLALAFAGGAFARLQAKWFGSPHLPVSDRVTIGTEAGYPPFSFDGTDGGVTGFNPDLIREVTAAAGLNVSIVYRPWAELRRELQEGDIDAIAGMYYSPERDSAFDFSPAFATIHHAVFAGAGSPDISTEADLHGKRIMVMRNDIMHEYAVARNLTDSLVLVDTQADAIRLLQAGAPGYALLAKLPGLYWKKELGAGLVRITGPVLLPSRYCLAVHEGNTALLQRLEDGLAVIEQTGQYDSLYRKWMGTLEPDSDIFRALGVVALVLLVLLAGAAAWSILLQRQVRLRTEALEEEVTGHRRTSERLLRLEVAVESAVDGIALTDMYGNIIYSNTAFARMHEYTREEIIGQHISIFHTPEQMRDEVEPFNETVKQAGENRGEMNHVTKHGRSFPTVMATTLMRGKDGTPVGLVGVAHDITERKEAEDELRRVNTQLSATLEALPDLCLEIDIRGMIHSYHMPAGGRPAGLPERVAGQHVRDVFASDAADKVIGAVHAAAAKGVHTGTTYTRTSDGGTRWFELSVASVETGDGREQRFIVLSRDITTRVRSEEELQKTQRLESLGLLAGGIAHDFNNLLAGIFGNIELARYGIDDAVKAAGYLETAVQAIGHTRELTQQLLTFAKGGAPLQKDVPLLPLVEDARALALGGSGTVCDVLVPDDLPDVSADPGQINQVLNNVLLNARQAMHESGRIIVTSAVEDVADGDVPGLQAGRYVVLYVNDNGPGMPEEVWAKVLEPFFSTRPDGTGLGLAICHSIMKKHGGTLLLDSEVGKGTTVTLYLPASTGARNYGPALPEADENEPVPAAPDRIRRILVMDDEEMVREVLMDMLGEAGYAVTGTVDGPTTVAAFSRAEEAGEPFDLVILDLTVPGDMKGEHVLDAVRKLRPGIPAVVTSGYTGSPVLAEPGLFGFQGKVEKPFKKAELYRVVKEHLK